MKQRTSPTTSDESFPSLKTMSSSADLSIKVPGHSRRTYSAVVRGDIDLPQNLLHPQKPFVIMEESVKPEDTGADQADVEPEQEAAGACDHPGQDSPLVEEPNPWISESPVSEERGWLNWNPQIDLYTGVVPSRMEPPKGVSRWSILPWKQWDGARQPSDSGFATSRATFEAARALWDAAGTK